MSRSSEKQGLLSINYRGDEEVPSHNADGAGFWGSVFNLANAAVGAGILAFPYAFAKAGLGVGILIAVSFATILGMGLHVIGMASTRAREINPDYRDGSYQELVKTILGWKAEKLVTSLMIIYIIGSCIAYLNVMRDQAHSVLVQVEDYRGNPHSTWALDGVAAYEKIVPIAAWTICFPLSLIPNMKWFALPSTLSQGGIVFALGVIVYYSAKDGSTNQKIWAYKPANVPGDSVGVTAMDIFTALPLIAFSFQCHLTYPLVYASLKTRTLKNMDWVSVACMASCAMIYTAGGVAGYRLLGASTPSDILQGLCATGTFYIPQAHHGSGCCTNVTMLMSHGFQEKYESQMENIPCESQKVNGEIVAARLFIAIKVACSYAMLCFVCRCCIKDLIWGSGAKPFSTVGYVVETVLFVGTTMFAAIYCKGLEVALGFVGIIVVVMTSIFPGCLLITISKSQGATMGGYGLVVFGVFTAVVSIVAQVHSMTGNHTKSNASATDQFGDGYDAFGPAVHEYAHQVAGPSSYYLF